MDNQELVGKIYDLQTENANLRAENEALKDENDGLKMMLGSDGLTRHRRQVGKTGLESSNHLELFGRDAILFDDTINSIVETYGLMKSILREQNND